jgi:NAD(P)-dependent dehydrogenase (short-subunit alcohol dehydrogenase family)
MAAITMNHFLIISGTSDIGQALKQRLVAKGHHVHYTSRSVLSDPSEANVSVSQLDPTNFLAVTELFESLKAKFGQIDGVVNCSGSLLLKPAHLTSAEDYANVIAANLTTAFAVAHAAGKTMTSHGGSVVLLSSVAAKIGISNHEAIAAAKAGIIGLVLSAAATYASANLRFNAIAPGLVETKLTKNLVTNPMMRKASEAMHPLQRIGTPDDIAAAIEFLLMPENNWISGQVLAVDGGLSSLRSKIKG